MSEEYGKEKQNYNFWSEQAKLNPNNDEMYNESKIDWLQENTFSQEIEQLQENTFFQKIEQPQENIFSQEIEQPKETIISQDEKVVLEKNTIFNQADSVMEQREQQYQSVLDNHSEIGIFEGVYQNKEDASNEQNIPKQLSENRKEKKSKNEGKGVQKKIVGLVASAAIFGVVAGGVFSGVQYVGNKMFPNKTEIEKTTINQNTGNKISTTTVSDRGVTTGPTDVTSVVEKTMPSIVSITSKITINNGYFGTQDSEGSGSGIIINKSDKELLIVTNNHVIADANTISVKFIDDSVVEAVVKGTSSTADLAVLSVKLTDIKEATLNKISVIEMGNSSDIKVGQMAIAIGNALGYGQSVTVGYISAKDREVEVEESNIMKLLQTDAAINPGNSGGALLDKDGKLIGINSAKYSDTSVEGMGYAIPVSAATPIINDLMKREVLSEKEKGYLGVSIAPVTEEMANAYNMPKGVYINAVSEDGAAKAAGILVGDIIIKVGDIETKTAEALQEKVNSLRAGTKVKVTLMRYVDGTYEEKQVEVTLKDKETLNSLEEENEQSQNNNSNSQQSPNQGNGDSSQNNNGNYNWDNDQNGQQITPNDEDSLQQFFEYYFGE